MCGLAPTVLTTMSYDPEQNQFYIPDHYIIIKRVIICMYDIISYLV
jgi:hypothetical protein